MDLLGVKLQMSSSHNSPHDGQSEVMNRILEDYLRNVVVKEGKIGMISYLLPNFATIHP